MLQEVCRGVTNVNLTELIGSRLYHDLNSPIGAFTIRLELLKMAGGVQGPEMELNSGSARGAGVQTGFISIAFNPASDQPKFSSWGRT